MKITDVKQYHFTWERGPFHWRDGIMPQGSMGTGGLLRIFTDEGIEGVSTLKRPINLDEVKFNLVGNDPINRERYWQAFWKNLRTSQLGDAIGPVDVALWDILGKMTGQPVYRLLGGLRDEIPAYASTLTLDSIDEYMVLADKALEMGFKAIKLHAWGRLNEDAKLCRALRKHVGDDIGLMYDASSMFHMLDDAIAFGRVLEEENYLWYEEPMDHFSIQALARLREKLTIPLAVAEATFGGPFDALTQILNNAGDIILTGPLDPYVGGFTGVMKTSAICQGFGIMCAIHGSDISHLHSSCATENCKYYERLWPLGFLEAPGVKTTATQIDARGYARPGNAPGMGMEIDWDWVDQH